MDKQVYEFAVWQAENSSFIPDLVNTRHLQTQVDTDYTNFTFVIFIAF